MENTRYLYILNNEGYGFFKGEDNKPTPFKTIEIEDSTSKGRFESNAFTIKLYSQTDDKEYLLSISKGNQYAEIYDLYENHIYFKCIEDAFGELHDVFSYVIANLKFTTNDNKNTYLLGLLATEYPGVDIRDRYFYLKKVQFTSLNIKTNNPTIETTKVLSSYSRMISCYETSINFNIVCFFKNVEEKYIMIVYNKDLIELKNSTLADSIEGEECFYKCAHFFGETGVFAYFTINTNLLKFDFKKYSDGFISDCYTNIPYLIIQNYTFNQFLTLSDIIKVKDKKIYYAGVSEDNKILYIISIINYSEDKFMVRIYSINTYNLKNYSIYFDLGIVIYKNFLAMGSSFHIGEILTSYSSLMIFSYPNTTNTSTEISQYLFNNNDTKIYNLSIELTGTFIMENNIFGYVYSGVQIIENCNELDDIYFIYENGLKIDTSYFLEKNTTVKLKIPKANNYAPFNCLFKYASTVTEPDYDKFNEYPIYLYDTSETNKENLFFERTNYIGKNSYYNLYLEEELTENDCGLNCELCYSSNKNKCVSCIYGSYISNEGKICLDEIQQSPQDTEAESPTETESSTETEASTETEPSSERQEFTEIESSIETQTSSETESSTEIQSSEKPSEPVKNEEICEINEILDNKCKGEITEEQIEKIYSYIKQNLISNYNENDNIIINSENAIFQISSSEEQKNSNNPNISNIDLGECEIELKRKNNISESKSLLIFKTDIKNDDKTSTYIQYEVYNPDTHIQLNMSVCQNLKIDIYAPVSLNSETSELFSSLINSGYNLFNENDSFYNEICTPYTTKNGTDMLLIDRKIDIYSKSGNIPLCQRDCHLEFYNETSKKAKCNCAIQPDDTNTNAPKPKFDKKDISDNFFKTLSNSNFLVLKCYKLAFDFSNFIENIGRIIMTLFFGIIIVLLIIYCFKGNHKLHLFLKEILNFNLKEENNSNHFDRNINHKKTSNYPDNKNKKNESRKNSHRHSHKNHNSFKEHKSNKNKEEKSKNKKKKETINNNTLIRKSESHLDIKKNEENKINDKIELNKNNFPTKKKKRINMNPEEENIMSSLSKINDRKVSKLYTKRSEKKEKETNKNQDKKEPRKSLKFSTVKNLKLNLKLSFNNHEKMELRKKSQFSANKLDNKELRKNKKESTKNPEYLNNRRKARNSIQVFKIKEKSNDSLILDKTVNNEKNIFGKKKSYTEQELNNLEYELAKEYDKRTFLQYYWSLLKKKHLILFTFLPAEDYNLLTIKIALFIISFSLYFTINGFFFTDKSMHNVYKYNGAFKFVYQIPQILYSTIVSAFINFILKKLSLSEENILEIKRESNEEKAKKKSKKIENCLRIKFIVFFSLSILFMFFFWYFITCFCAVYKNTQMILIKDTLISFGISMLYPFGINLIPGILRIIALRAKTDRKLLYKISLIIALF